MRDNHQESAPNPLGSERAGQTPVAALRHRDFSIYWSGSVVSLVGSQFTTVAMAWQIYELTNSPLELGLLGLARGAPMLVLLLFGGLLADAVNRRHLMMATQIAQMCVSASLAVMTLLGRVSPTGPVYRQLVSCVIQLARAAGADRDYPEPCPSQRSGQCACPEWHATPRGNHRRSLTGGPAARSQRCHALLRGRRGIMARDARRACHDAAPRPGRSAGVARLSCTLCARGWGSCGRIR